jgi:hypothetical protein
VRSRYRKKGVSWLLSFEEVNFLRYMDDKIQVYERNIKWMKS